MNVASGWSTLAGNLQAASQRLAGLQADLLASGWRSPATAEFTAYLAAWQAKAQGLMGAAQAVGGGLSRASEVVDAVSGALSSPPVSEEDFRALPPLLQLEMAERARTAVAS